MIQTQENAEKPDFGTDLAHYSSVLLIYTP